MEAGQRWGYRSHSGEALVQVEVLRLGIKRPARVLVRFVDDEQEGREQWVPPARLKVRWSEADAFMDRDRQWAAARSLSVHVRDSTEHSAAGQVIEHAYPDEIASAAFRSADSGLLYVQSLERLLGDLGWTHEWFVSQPAVFWDAPDRAWVAPWPVTLVVAQALAPLHAETLLEVVAADERQARHKAVHGVTYGRGASAWDVRAETCAEVDAEYGRPVRELIRHWCGWEAVDRRDELEALRSEVRRLGVLVAGAVEVLRAAGQRQAAAKLEKDIGVLLAWD